MKNTDASWSLGVKCFSEEYVRHLVRVVGGIFFTFVSSAGLMFLLATGVLNYLCSPNVCGKSTGALSINVQASDKTLQRWISSTHATQGRARSLWKLLGKTNSDSIAVFRLCGELQQIALTSECHAIRSGYVFINLSRNSNPPGDKLVLRNSRYATPSEQLETGFTFGPIPAESQSQYESALWWSITAAADMDPKWAVYLGLAVFAAVIMTEHWSKLSGLLTVYAWSYQKCTCSGVTKCHERHGCGQWAGVWIRSVWSLENTRIFSNAPLWGVKFIWTRIAALISYTLCLPGLAPLLAIISQIGNTVNIVEKRPRSFAVFGHFVLDSSKRLQDSMKTEPWSNWMTIPTHNIKIIPRSSPILAVDGELGVCIVLWLCLVAKCLIVPCFWERRRKHQTTTAKRVWKFLFIFRFLCWLTDLKTDKSCRVDRYQSIIVSGFNGDISAVLPYLFTILPSIELPNCFLFNRE